MLKRFSSKQAFCIALLALTLLPIGFFIFFSRSTDVVGVAETKWLLMLIGVAHVPATFAFYANSHFWQIARGNMLRYAWTPLLLVVGTGLAFAMADALVQGFILAGYWLWADMALRPAKHRCERFYIDWRNGQAGPSS